MKSGLGETMIFLCFYLLNNHGGMDFAEYHSVLCFLPFMNNFGSYLVMTQVSILCTSVLMGIAYADETFLLSSFLSSKAYIYIYYIDARWLLCLQAYHYSSFYVKWIIGEDDR